jgi:hypothetical protein
LVVGGIGIDPSQHVLNFRIIDLQSAKVIKTWIYGRDSIPFGHTSCFNRQSDELLLVGGGAVCSSMENVFNEPKLVLLKDEWIKQASPLPWIRQSPGIKRVSLAELSEELMSQAREPFIVSGLKMPNLNDIISSVPAETKIGAHVSNDPVLSFSVNGTKNYHFESMAWSNFCDRLQKSGEHMYLRSIGSNPRKDVSHLGESFPELAHSLKLPSELIQHIYGAEIENQALFVRQAEQSKYFSSILRASTPGLQLWTHFDVMDNFLVQLTGTKLITLFPPQQSRNLYVGTEAHQSSSPVVNIFAPYSDPYSVAPSSTDDRKLYPQFYSEAVKHAIVDVLRPGDVLFIPSLWYHNVYTLSGHEPSFSVNTFFRHLDSAEYNRKDLYGNKDLLRASEAQILIEKAMDMMKGLDPHYYDFYIDRFKAILR